MKVLMVVQHINFFRNLDTVMRELCGRGHEVVFLHGTQLEDASMREKMHQKKRRMVFMGRGLQVAQSEIQGVTTGYRPEPPEAWPQALMVGRQVLNRGVYFRKGHPSPERVVDGIEKGMTPELQRKVNSRLWRTALARPAALSAWRCLEAASPPSPSITKLLQDVQPDVALISPTIWPKQPVEADYLHAARLLGIPTIGYVNSWDNLTSKGTVHVVPDVFIVWNEPIAEEAVSLHDVPRSAIRITGAPHLDRFFALSPSAPRDEVCRQMGCPDTRPYIVYLCSSRSLMATEVDVVTEMADAFAAQFDGDAPTLLVRPHPTNPVPWDNYEHPGVVIYPKNGDQADTPAAWQEYFDQLSQAAAVFGVNTTAFLESVVANRPCLTMVRDDFFGGQGRTGHFRHLLKGDFMEVSANVTEVAARVARILAGADEKAEGRRQFTKWFIRPCGLDIDATQVVADVIESAARPSAAAASTSPHTRDAVPGLAYQGHRP